MQKYSIDIEFCEKVEEAKPQTETINIEAEDAYSAYSSVYEANKKKYCALKYKYVWYRPRLSDTERNRPNLKNEKKVEKINED